MDFTREKSRSSVEESPSAKDALCIMNRTPSAIEDQQSTSIRRAGSNRSIHSMTTGGSSSKRANHLSRRQNIEAQLSKRKKSSRKKPLKATNTAGTTSNVPVTSQTSSADQSPQKFNVHEADRAAEACSPDTPEPSVGDNASKSNPLNDAPGVTENCVADMNENGSFGDASSSLSSHDSPQQPLTEERIFMYDVTSSGDDFFPNQSKRTTHFDTHLSRNIHKIKNERTDLYGPSTDKASGFRNETVCKPQNRRRKVKFSHLEIRLYDRLLGDNPCCSSGPPLSIDWTYYTFAPTTSREKAASLDPVNGKNSVKTELRIPVDAYEKARGERMPTHHLILSREKREEMLLASGYTPNDFAIVVRNMIRIKNQRRQTVDNLWAESMEERLERIRKGFSRLCGRKKGKSRYLYDKWLISKGVKTNSTSSFSKGGIFYK